MDLSTTAPLVGRSDELDQLAALAGVGADGINPVPGAVVLSGDAGIGKTRVLTALQERAAEQGWRLAVGQCMNLGGSPLPYLPFTEIFAKLEAMDAALVEAAATQHPAVRRLLPTRGPESDSGEHQMDRAGRFASVHAVLSLLGAERPLLLIFEDVHWADQSSYDLLSFLLARSFEVPVSLVVSYRSDDLHRRHPLRTIATRWLRLPRVGRVDLSPLPDAAMRSLIRQLHPARIEAAELRGVIDRAEGNAFFAEELVAAQTVGRGPLPWDLAGLLLVRLDQLDESARQVVRAAAISGRKVTHQVLSRVVDLDPRALDDALRTAVELNVLVADGPDGYAFRHALLGEAVYEDLLPGERVRLHAAYVRVLQSPEVTTQPAADLARHAFAAHDHETALRASIAAGEAAVAVGGPDEALRHYELALELAADSGRTATDGVDLIELISRASAAAMLAGNPHQAIALVQDQLDIAPPDLDPIDRARLLLALTSATVLADFGDDALALTTEALALVPVDSGAVHAEPLTVLRCQIVAIHAQALSDRHRDEDATRWGEEAILLARSLGLRDVIANVTSILARIRERNGDSDTSLQVLEGVIAEGRANGDVGELRALYHLASIHLERGNLDEAQLRYQQCVDRAAEYGRPYGPWGLDARMLSAVVAYQRGDWDGVLQIADITGETPPPIAEHGLAAMRLAVAAGRGEQAAVEQIPHIRPSWSSDGVIAIYTGTAGVDLYGDAGDLSSAITLHEEVVISLESLWQLKDFQAAIRLNGLLLGQIASHISTATSSAKADLLQRAGELADSAARAFSLGRLRHHRGPESLAWQARVEAEELRLRWLADDHPPTAPQLVSSWQESVAAFETYPHVFELARSRARLAAVLRATGDNTQAAEIAALAFATAQDLQAAPLLAELAPFGPSTGSGSGRTGSGNERRSDRGAPPLTPREREVLALVAEGRSNREVGSQLFISTKTASVHVSNILAKLGAAGRTEAVAVARRHGLL